MRDSGRRSQVSYLLVSLSPCLSLTVSPCHLVIVSPPHRVTHSRIVRLDPATAAGRALDRVEDRLAAQAVLERRRRRAAGGDAVEQIVYAVCESVLPADDMAGRPPRADILVRAVGHQDVAEAAHLRRV